MQTFEIEVMAQVDDGIGGFTENLAPFKTVQGYLDLITGTDLNTLQNAFTEQSTHVLIIPQFTDGITDKMRVVDSQNRYYTITYADDPVGAGHHNELYVKYGGVLNG
ncbi:TPA: head-tail adaptor protein [Streptococcus suis]